MTPSQIKTKLIATGVPGYLTENNDDDFDQFKILDAFAALD